MSLSKIAEVYTQNVINENKDLTSGQAAPGKKLSGDYLEGDNKTGHGGADEVKDIKKPEQRKEKEDSSPKVLKASFDPFNDLYNKIIANEDFGNWEAAEDAQGDESGPEVNLSFTGDTNDTGSDEDFSEEEGEDEELGLSAGGLGDVIKHLQAAVEALQALQGEDEDTGEESGEDEDAGEDFEGLGDGEESGEESGEEDEAEEKPFGESAESDEEEDEEEDEVEESCETTIIGHALTTGLKKLHGDFSNPKANKPNFGLPKPGGAAKVAPGTKAHELKVLVKDIGKKAIFNKLQKGHKVDKTAGSDGYDKPGSKYGYGG